ncbi:hypothetical protein BGZ89_008275, partial [Linnemannia elongata]
QGQVRIKRQIPRTNSWASRNPKDKSGYKSDNDKSGYKSKTSLVASLGTSLVADKARSSQTQGNDEEKSD